MNIDLHVHIWVCEILIKIIMYNREGTLLKLRAA